MSKNDLSMAYTIRRRPRGMSVLKALRAVRAGVDADGELPEGFTVEWRWRNTPAQDLRVGDFGTVVTESRAGFHTLMRQRLDRDILRATLSAPPKPPPKKKRRRRRTKAEYRAAALKGWRTRRARAAVKFGRQRQRIATRQVRAAHGKKGKRR